LLEVVVVVVMRLELVVELVDLELLLDIIYQKVHIP
jgi:hypothetical protein